MLAWLSKNALTIGILLVLAGAVSAVVFSLIRNHKKGRTPCGCGCKDCAMRGCCHKNTVNPQ